jgi:hypothetical protein
MKIVGGGILGVLGGLLYAFISFYLLTPVLRKNFVAIAFYGFQGLVFGIVFAALKLITNKIAKEKNLKFISNIAIGAIAGFLSSIHNVAITYYNAVLKSPGFVPDELRINIISELLHFSVGCLLLGLIIGFIIGLFDQKEMINLNK